MDRTPLNERSHVVPNELDERQMREVLWQINRKRRDEDDLSSDDVADVLRAVCYLFGKRLPTEYRPQFDASMTPTYTKVPRQTIYDYCGKLKTSEKYDIAKAMGVADDPSLSYIDRDKDVIRAIRGEAEIGRFIRLVSEAVAARG